MSSSSAAVIAETSGPDPEDRPGDVAAHAGVSSASGYDALRADIRRLSTMLGQTLVHHGGPELLELVEQVRRLSRSAVAGDEGGDAEITRLLAGLDTGTAVALTRAFSQYFQLANIAEQRHRAREFAAGAQGRGPLRRLMERLAGGDAEPSFHAEVQDVLARAELRPVFTAHPTESSRQSVLAILRRVADGLDREAPTRSWPRWSSCSGRPTSCARASRRWPTRPGRSAGTWSSWAAARCPTCSARSSGRCARPASRCPSRPGRSRWAAGSAATGTATRTSPRR